MAARFEIKDVSGWRWKLIDDNNEPIAQSEPYKGGADSAAEGARNVQTTAPAARITQERGGSGARFEVYDDHGWRWLLIDDNNEPIAQSEPYASAANAKRGAENVKATAPGASIARP